MTLLHSERGNCASYVFLASGSITLQLLRNFIPLMIPFPLPRQLFPTLVLLFNFYACSDLTLKQTLPAYLHCFAWLTPTRLSNLCSHEASPPCPRFYFSLFLECPVHISCLTYILYCSLLFLYDCPSHWTKCNCTFYLLLNSSYLI